MVIIIEVLIVEDVFKIVVEVYEFMFKFGVEWVLIIVWIDDRRDKECYMEDKVKLVMEKVRGG